MNLPQFIGLMFVIGIAFGLGWGIGSAIYSALIAIVRAVFGALGRRFGRWLARRIEPKQAGKPYVRLLTREGDGTPEPEFWHNTISRG